MAKRLPDLERKLRAHRKMLIRESRKALTALGRSWRLIVRHSTWKSKNASPKGLVIARILDINTIEIGWINYPSGDAAARKRFEERGPKLIAALERIKKKYGRMMVRGLL